jgi:hypothetical protein
VPHFVIPAKSAVGGREPGSRNNLIILTSNWIPDLARFSGLVLNDGFDESIFQVEERFSLPKLTDEIRNSKRVLVIEYWNLRFVCNLVLVICDFPHALGLMLHASSATDN